MEITRRFAEDFNRRGVDAILDFSDPEIEYCEEANTMRADHPGPFARRALGASLMLTGLLTATGTGLAQAAQHPLDPLGWEEHWVVLDAIRSAGHGTDSTRYALVTLKEPDKGAVATWSPGEPFGREAFAIVKEGTRTFEAVLDLVDEAVVSWTLIDGVQPGQRYDIYHQDKGEIDGREELLTPYVYGRVVVLLAKQESATAVITKSKKPVRRGDLFKSTM